MLYVPLLHVLIIMSLVGVGDVRGAGALKRGWETLPRDVDARVENIAEGAETLMRGAKMLMQGWETLTRGC
jgi:hypothetical protein